LMIRNATIAEVASTMLASMLEQPVVDQTELGATRYDFILKFTPDAQQLAQLGLPGDGRGPGAPPAPAATDPDAPPDLFAAFEQQLGLKLESTKAPVDVLVIDKAEKPNEN
jgi:uncharacterized protein (TIGR03435 family)